jgi:hypothetical protein
VTRSQSADRRRQSRDRQGGRKGARAQQRRRCAQWRRQRHGKTSVDVTGNGVASADAGGSIGIAGGGVKVETWGRTSAEVF